MSIDSKPSAGDFQSVLVRVPVAIDPSPVVEPESALVTALKRENARLAEANAAMLGRNAELERQHQKDRDEIHALRCILHDLNTAFTVAMALARKAR